jgi:hypothetical protein
MLPMIIGGAVPTPGSRQSGWVRVVLILGALMWGAAFPLMFVSLITHDEYVVVKVLGGVSVDHVYTSVRNLTVASGITGFILL